LIDEKPWPAASAALYQTGNLERVQTAQT